MTTDRELTPEAEAERADFQSEYGYDGNCSCHLSPPCGSCTHPGNPRNQAEDDTCWIEPERIESAPPKNRARITLMTITTAAGKVFELQASDLRLWGAAENMTGERTPMIAPPSSLTVALRITGVQQEALRKWLDEVTRKSTRKFAGTPLERPAREKAQWKRERSKFRF